MNPRVLIVDDVDDVRASIAELLEASGEFELAGEASSGRDAIRLASETKPDLVVMDIRMPNMDGIEATRAIKRDQPMVAVVAHSAYQDASLVHDMIAAGALGYVLKGGGGERLLEALRAAAEGNAVLEPQIARALVDDLQVLYAGQVGRAEALAETGVLLTAILDSTADGILAVDSAGHIIHSNGQFADLWRIPRELLERGDDDALLSYVLDQVTDPDAFVAKVRELYVSPGESLESIDFKDGRIFKRYSRPLLDNQGIAGRVWSFRDITASQQATLALRDSEERFRALVQNSSDMIIILDAMGALTYISPSVERIMGHGLEGLRRESVLSYIHPDDLPGAAQSLAEVVTTGGAHPPMVLRLRHADGSWREIEVLANNMLDDPAVRGVVYNARDVTERNELEQQLRHQAFHDPLTGLANRVLFGDRVANALDRARRTGDPVAVLFVDIDNFKTVNDAFGHQVGDEVLIQVASRISEILRPGDTAARFGGDEFTLLLEGLPSLDAVAVGERILRALRVPFQVADQDVFVQVSIGVSVGTTREATVDSLVRDADAAMYAAKSRGKARVELYDKGLHVSLHDRLRLLADLQRAAERGQFFIEYQPTFDLANRRLVGAEALVRWNHPERGTLPPRDFISLAEESGVIHGLGEWMLKEACSQAKRWQDRYSQVPAFHVAVNVSGHQLQHGFADEVAATIASSRIDPATLILEVTESVMMRDIPSTIGLLNQLKALGLRLAIDDFGTGYSSLSYLRQFPFDILKVDKSFVDDIGSDKQHELTTAIIEIGRTLHLEIVAEGIESEDQLKRLLSLGCDLGQGYYFSKPMNAREMESLMRLTTERQAA